MYELWYGADTETAGVVTTKMDRYISKIQTNIKMMTLLLQWI